MGELAGGAGDSFPCRPLAEAANLQPRQISAGPGFAAHCAWQWWGGLVSTWPSMKMIIIAVAAAGLAALPAADVRAESEEARLHAFFTDYLEQSFVRRPLDATRLGDHRYDHLLDDLAPGRRQEWDRFTRETLEKLPKAVAAARLTPEGGLDYAIFEHELRKSLWLAENTRPFEHDPRVYNEYINDSVYLLLTQSTLPRETNIANAIARVRLVPRVVAAARASLDNPPRVVTETAIRQNRGSLAFYERDLLDLAGETPQKAALQTAAAAAAASLKEYQEFLEKDLLPRAQGEWRIGPEKFARKLEWELDSGRTAAELLADAEGEFTRVVNDMYVIARQLWSRYQAGKALPPDDAAGRQETIRQVLRQVAQDHGEAQNVFRDARATVAGIKEFIAAGDILRLPDPDRCQVIEMPEFQRGNSTAYLNSAPPLDPRADSIYAVSPPPQDWDAARVRSYLEEYNRHMLQILTIHEAYPGHYVQLEYANRNPSPIRKILQSGVFIEGWAVYTEQMMLDQGYGGGDLPLRLTQLKFYLRAVANAILDHHLHCRAMTDEQAMDLLVNRSFQAEGEARLKVIRAKQGSCQLSTYFAGRMAHYRLRQQIERELGDRFHLGRYHEAVLAHGSVPVKYLPELVRQRLQRDR